MGGLFLLTLATPFLVFSFVALVLFAALNFVCALHDARRTKHDGFKGGNADRWVAFTVSVIAAGAIGFSTNWFWSY